MSAFTLVHAAVVGLLLGGAAATLEAALRQRRLPARGLWVAALALTAAAPLWGPALQRTSVADLDALDALAALAPPVPGGAAVAEAALSPASRLVQRLDENDPRIAIFWIVTAAGTLLVVGGAFLRLTFRVARLPRGRVGGDEVVISPTFGPACVGLGHARVVIPRWLLSLGRTEVDLVLRHERSHAEARDPLVLALGLVAVALAPWNPALWLHMGRLRRAVELDCDRRVLASGAAPGAYGRVLLSVLGRMRTRSFPAPALLEPTTFLERRLKLMRHRLPTPPHHTLGTLALAAALVALACETPAPSPVAPAAPAEGRAGEVLVDRAPTATATPAPAIYVDGVLVQGSPLDDVRPDEVASIEVLKGPAALAEHGEEGRYGVVKISTKAAASERPDVVAPTRRPLLESDLKEAPSLSDRPASGSEPAASMQAWAVGKRPLVLLDGKRLDGGVDALVALPKEGPRAIASIEIVKGGAAEAIHGPAAKDGVIVVKTTGGGGGD